MANQSTFDLGSDTGLLIDWITLRMPVRQLPPSLQDRLFENMDTVACLRLDKNGEPVEVRWETKRLNFDALRSDSEGLYWTCTWVGAICYLYIGASPASLEHGVNVFGSMDIYRGAEILLSRARRAFKCLLAPVEEWELCRADVTGNYALPDFNYVKTCLKTLLGTDSSRRKASSAKNGGDTVVWSPTSDVFGGKAYHKGPHLRYLVKKGQLHLDETLLDLADRLVRLELRVGSRFWRLMREDKRHRFFGKAWFSLSAAELALLHREFFAPICSGIEVNNMGRVKIIEMIAAKNAISQGRAKAAYGTLRNIREMGVDECKASMAERTFYLHQRYLREAGFTDADLRQSNVFQLKPVRIVLAQPVGSWDELRRAA